MPGTFNVAVAVNAPADAASVPLQIQFDPKLLRLNDVSAGDLLAQGGVLPLLAKNIQNDAGTASVQISRPPGTPGVSSAGVLVTLNFQVMARGNTNVTLTGVAIRNSQNQVIGGGNASLPVRIE